MLTNKEKIRYLMTRTWFWLAISIVFALAVMLFDFSVLGLYQDKNDTQGYMDVVAYFDGQPVPAESSRLTIFHIRLLKPLYGLICSSLTPLLSAYQAMLLLNMAFYFGTIILLFILLKKYFNFRPSMAALGTAWFACSYPMLKYGFALMTDISGYFFILLTVLLALIGFTKNKYIYFFAAGMAAGIGITAKESGAFGLLFIFIYSLIQIRKTGTIKTLKRLLLVALPFLLIFGLSQILIIYKTNYSYLNFFTLSENEYAAQFRTWKYFLGSQLATFHLLWLPFFYGLYKAIASNKYRNESMSLIAAGFPALLWPVYIVRGLFVQYIFVIPIALFGTIHFLNNHKIGLKIPRLIKIVLFSLPCLISLGLVLFSGSYSIWKILNI